MNVPKYKKIYDHIVKLILKDEWPVGSNMKSENELIKFFGVSRLTIRTVSYTHLTLPTILLV